LEAVPRVMTPTNSRESRSLTRSPSDATPLRARRLSGSITVQLAMVNSVTTAGTTWRMQVGDTPRQVAAHRGPDGRASSSSTVSSPRRHWTTSRARTARATVPATDSSAVPDELSSDLPPLGREGQRRESEVSGDEEVGPRRVVAQRADVLCSTASASRSSRVELSGSMISGVTTSRWYPPVRRSRRSSTFEGVARDRGRQLVSPTARPQQAVATDAEASFAKESDIPSSRCARAELLGVLFELESDQ